jgi:oligopeptide/dipeptide ABC transporter ATP-binding protein
MKNNEIIGVRDVSVSYEISSKTTLTGKGYFKAVNDVDISLEYNDSLSIVGESGSGKTTLALAIIGLLEISKGSILYNFSDLTTEVRADKKATRRNLKGMWKRTSIVFQDPYSSLDNKMIVRDIIAEPYLGHKLGRREEIYDKIGDMITSVGLKKEHLDYLPDQLSGGLRQRVAIARSLVNEPELIIFDEPTSSLDVSVQAQILNLIMDIKRKTGLTYIFITHNLALARHISNKIVVMYLGSVMESGTTTEVYENPLHPYTKLLLSSILTPEEGSKIDALSVSSESYGENTRGCVFHNRCTVSTEYCGWTPKEVIESIRSETFAKTGDDKINFEILNDNSFIIKDETPSRLAEIKLVISEISGKKRYKTIQETDNGLRIELQEPWKPLSIKLNGGRTVKCMLYDRGYSEK